MVAADILRPLPESEAGNSYLLVAGEYFTRWMEAYSIPKMEATTVARKLTDECFCCFDMPEQLHSDQGKQFESKLLNEVCIIMRIDKTRTNHIIHNRVDLLNVLTEHCCLCYPQVLMITHSNGKNY